MEPQKTPNSQDNFEKEAHVSSRVLHPMSEKFPKQASSLWENEGNL